MLDTSKVGSYISKLRKERDWTQMELADRLNVSHHRLSKEISNRYNKKLKLN